MRYLVALLALALLAVDADAQGRRGRRWSYQPDVTWAPAARPVEQAAAFAPPYAGPSAAAPAVEAGPALQEVNAARAQRGLPPFLPDPLLDQAAQTAAQRRASRLCAGHLPEGDFGCLPPGAHAASAGCAAWTPDWGWGSCCTYDRYAYAGAAVALGADGKRYMHLFVR